MASVVDSLVTLQMRLVFQSLWGNCT